MMTENAARKGKQGMYTEFWWKFLENGRLEELKSESSELRVYRNDESNHIHHMEN
jgi:hypothetical protein